MTPEVYFVVGVDSDPKRSPFGTRDDDVLQKYTTAFDLLKRSVGGKSIICVHTSPLYRERFFRPPFIHFWETWVRGGGELMLHPEEDLYPLPGSVKNETYYKNPPYMEGVIKEKVDFMKKRELPFAGFRGAFFGLTGEIVGILIKVGIEIDLSCAPGIVRPGKAADWSEAPASGYYLSQQFYRRARPGRVKRGIFEIPLGWDGQGTNVTENYLFHERSTYKKMSRVWNAIVKRGKQVGAHQFVGFLCHTHSMGNTRLRNQCEDILNYMREEGGIPVTASEAKRLYDNLNVVKRSPKRERRRE
jgi:hypothetical protein